MARIITGGPAFPNADRGYEGMDLRDWFAGQAMQAAVSGHISHYGHDNHWPCEGIVSHAYELADAMLAEKMKAEAANRAADKEEYGDDLPF